MTGIFGNLTNDGLEESQDRLGGFSPFDTDAYDATVKLAYAGKSDQGANSLTVVCDMPDGREYKETLWVTNKKGENFFLNQQDRSKKVPLPGFTVADDICLCTTEKPLAEQVSEEKVVNIYDYDQKKEVPTSVQVLTDLIGKPVTLGITRNLENKSVKQGNDYVPIADTRETNTIEKVFHTPTKLTMVEVRNGKTQAEFYTAWVERNKGQTRDRRKIKDGAQAGTAGRPSAGPPQAQAATSGAAPRKSLFGNS
jgi:hypothetical protein